MSLKFKHEGENYVLEGTLEGQTMKISLATGSRKFEEIFTYEEFPDEIKKAFDCLREIFEVMEDDRNIIVEPFKGVVILIVKICKKKKVIEIPLQIELAEVKRDGGDGQIFEGLKNIMKYMEGSKEKLMESVMEQL